MLQIYNVFQELFPAIRYNLFFFKKKTKGFSLLSGLGYGANEKYFFS